MLASLLLSVCLSAGLQYFNMKNFRDRYTVVNGIPTILPVKIKSGSSENQYLDFLDAGQIDPTIVIDLDKVDLVANAELLAAFRAKWDASDPDPNWYS